MNKKMTILGALLMAVAVTGYSVSGTYAKYTDTVSVGADTARVAKFNVEKLGSSTFKLFNMTSNNDGTDNILAPGFNNSIEFSFTNNVKVDSEVPTTSSFKLTDDSTSITYEIDGVVYDPNQYALIDVTAGEDETTATYGNFDALKTAVAGIKSDKSYKIAWKWVDSVDAATDAKDTKLGQAMYANPTDPKLNVKVDIEVVVTQDTTTPNTLA